MWPPLVDVHTHLLCVVSLLLCFVVSVFRIRNYSDTGKHLGPKVATSGKINYQDIVFENDQDEEFNANTLHVDSSDEEDA